MSPTYSMAWHWSLGQACDHTMDGQGRAGQPRPLSVARRFSFGFQVGSLRCRSHLSPNHLETSVCAQGGNIREEQNAYVFHFKKFEGPDSFHWSRPCVSYMDMKFIQPPCGHDNESGLEKGQA